jgi:ribosomal-protein-alanine N-acetyltransferase
MKPLKLELRFYKVSDAARVLKMVTNPKFKYFQASAKTVQDEKNWIKSNARKRKENIEWNYAILLAGEIVGGIGIKINQHRNYIGEIGYFVGEDYWGQGIATQAVKLAEKICFKELKLSRLEILMRPENKASEKVARKSGYKKEGLLKKQVKDRIGKLRDVYIYAKVL